MDTLKKKFKESKASSITPLRPHFKWVVVGFAALITIGSIIYTNTLVRQIRERERQQIDIYARSLEFLATADDNFWMVYDEIVAANKTIPVILTDEEGNPEDYKNLPAVDRMKGPEDRRARLLREIEVMRVQHEPIEVVLSFDGNVYGFKYIYYKNSFLLSRLKYYPYVQLSVIGVFGVITFFTFNYLRRAEQNRVWVGLAKETAHQLGTPISSLMAWSEYFKGLFPEQKEMLLEFDKDIDRLEVITDRFSSIGSEPQLEMQNVPDVIDEIVSYLSKRLSTKIEISASCFPDRLIGSRLNTSLFAWVIENLCKNAADAMEGKGAIHIGILKINDGQIAIDVKDTGKGIPKSQINNVFRPGFTTKKRGWGLGLALAKRIIEQYHQGKIFVKVSEINRGTTFRILLSG